MAPVGAKSTWEKYSPTLNSIHPEFKSLIWNLERIKDRLSKHEVSFLFDHGPEDRD